MKRMISLILALLVAIGGIALLLNLNGTFTEKPSEAFGVINKVERPSSGTSSDTSSGSSGESSGGDSLTHDYALRFGDPGFDELVYVRSSFSNYCMIGIIIPTKSYASLGTGLQYGKGYQVHWSISQGIYNSVLGVDVPDDVVDGYGTPCFYYNSNYSAGTGLGDIYYPADRSVDTLLNGNNGEGFCFTAGEEGQTSVLFMFCSTYESDEHMTEVLNSIILYINDLYFVGPAGG